MTKPKAPGTIKDMRRMLPKGFYCNLEKRSDGDSIHVWNTSDDFCFDADFYVETQRDRRRTIEIAWCAACMASGGGG